MKEPITNNMILNNDLLSGNLVIHIATFYFFVCNFRFNVRMVQDEKSQIIKKENPRNNPKAPPNSDKNDRIG